MPALCAENPSLSWSLFVVMKAVSCWDVMLWVMSVMQSLLISMTGESCGNYMIWCTHTRWSLSSCRHFEGTQPDWNY